MITCGVRTPWSAQASSGRCGQPEDLSVRFFPFSEATQTRPFELIVTLWGLEQQSIRQDGIMTLWGHIMILWGFESQSGDFLHRQEAVVVEIGSTTLEKHVYTALQIRLVHKYSG